MKSGVTLPGFRFVSVKGWLDKIAVEGTFLTLEELYALVSWMEFVTKVRKFFKKHEEECPLLHQLMGAHPFRDTLAHRIGALFDERGNLRDDASPELLRIRQGQQQAMKSLRSLLSGILQDALKNNWTIEKEITLRNDRLVIPIKADSKGRVPGFVQDVSQSGNTVFVEPTQALPLNNRIKELHFAEQNEILRIVQGLSRDIRAELSHAFPIPGAYGKPGTDTGQSPTRSGSPCNLAED